MNSTLLMTPAVGMVIALILGVFVISNKPSQKINQVFSLLCFETFIWQLCWFVSYFITGPHLKDLVVRIALSDVVFIPFTYYHFTIIFLGASTQKNRAWSAYSFATIFLILIWASNLFIDGYRTFWWGYYPKGGILFSFYLVGVISYMLRALFLIHEKLRNETDYANKNKIKYMALVLVLYFLATVEYAIDFGLPIYPIGSFFILSGWIITAYAITKHNLMDIKIIIQKTAIYSAFGAVMAAVFVSVVLFSESFFKELFGYRSVWITTSLVFVLAILLKPLYDKIQESTHRAFFKEKYMLVQSVKEIGLACGEKLGLKGLLRFATKSLQGSLKAKSVSFLEFDKESETYKDYSREE